MNITDFYQGLETDIAFVEERLHQQLKTTHPVLQEAATQLLSAGGKRLRPVFVLLSGTFGHYDLSILSNVAVALELIHMASLVHDDVIDDSPLRRGRPTVKATFGNKMAMYSGDFIFARALSILTSIQNVRLHHTLALAIERMCIGEIEQIRDQYKVNSTFKNYLRRIRRKTAFLIEMSCALGAMAAQCTDQEIAGLRRYGYYTGMAFQITDDILDFTATAEKLGKPVGSDLRQGNITLPALHALSSPQYGDNMRALLREGVTDDEVARMVAMIHESGGIEFAQNIADRYLEKASEGLAVLPEGSNRLALEAVAAFIGQRDN